MRGLDRHRGIVRSCRASSSQRHVLRLSSCLLCPWSLCRDTGPFPTVPQPSPHTRSRGGPMLAAVPSATLSGVDGRPVTVEVHVSNGLPAFTVVGLPDAAVRESRDRVRASVSSSGLTWPKHRITV